MIRIGLALAIVAALAAPAAAQVASPPTQRWLALDLDFGVAYDHELSGLHYEQRVGAGMSWAADSFWSVLATAETIDFDRYAFGVQGDVILFHTALGAYVGPSITTHGGIDLTAGFGWNVFFVEAQALDLNRSASYMVSAILRIPLGKLSFVLWGP